MSMNLLHYLGVEEQNLLTSLVKFREEFNQFSNLDGVYQAPISRLRIPEDDEPGLLICQLYLFVHFHLYFSLSCLLRSHLSDCLSSARKAIDAALSAYKVIVEPSTAGKYLKRDRYFLFIKRNMQKEIKANPSKYPLAPELLKIHEACSQYGSHADISSFIHRVEMKEMPGEDADLLQLYYFQFPKDENEYKFYFVLVLQTFFKIFGVFKVFFDKKLSIIDPHWEATIKALGPELDQRRQKYYSLIKR